MLPTAQPMIKSTLTSKFARSRGKSQEGSLRKSHTSAIDLVGPFKAEFTNAPKIGNKFGDVV